MRQQKKNSQVVGIDYGTGFSKIAYLDETGRPKVIPNLDGGPKTPSVVYFPENAEEILVGTSAVSMMFVAPDRTVKEAKRDIGSPKVYLVVKGADVTPVTVAAKTFEYLKQSAIEYFGADDAASFAVITGPAAFKDDQRQALMLAADKAGIMGLQLINEPMAAALAFGLNESRGDMLVVVADFGQGTFDVAIVQFGGGRADVIASAGDPRLGGKDVDDILLGMVKERFKAHGIEISEKQCPADYYGIWSECVRAKELLSSKTEVKLIARALGKQEVLEVSRDTLNSAVAPLMSRVENVTLQALGEAKVDLGDVNHVLFIGGSSRIPAFRKTIAGIFGDKKIIRGSVSPDLAVAEGAAIKAGQLVWTSGSLLVDIKTLRAIPAPPIESRDVMPHSLGVAVQDRESSGLYCAVVLEKNKPIPCTASQRFASVEAEQDKFKVIVLQGEDGQAIDDCLIVGEKQLRLPPRSPDKESLEVTMAYDESGMVDVNVKDLVSDTTANITVDHYHKERAKQKAGAAKQASQSKGRKSACKAKKV